MVFLGKVEDEITSRLPSFFTTPYSDTINLMNLDDKTRRGARSRQITMKYFI